MDQGRAGRPKVKIRCGGGVPLRARRIKMQAKRGGKFFYGWVVVITLFLVTMLPMVFISNFYSYYQVPICTEFGSSYVEFNISNIASTVAGMAFSLFVAGFVTKGNTRLWMFIGGATAALAMLAQSYITSLWQLYITFFITNFALSSMTYVPINYIISRWFVDKKALVTSIVFTGSGLGGVLFSGLASGIIEDMGWRAGFRVTAAIVFGTALLVLLLVRKAPEDMGLEPYRKAGAAESAAKSAAASGWAGLSRGEAVKTGAFWLYALCLVCCGIVAAGVATQIPTYLIENGIDYAPVFCCIQRRRYSGETHCRTYNRQTGAWPRLSYYGDSRNRRPRVPCVGAGPGRVVQLCVHDNPPLRFGHNRPRAAAAHRHVFRTQGFRPHLWAWQHGVHGRMHDRPNAHLRAA